MAGGSGSNSHFAFDFGLPRSCNHDWKLNGLFRKVGDAGNLGGYLYLKMIL